MIIALDGPAASGKGTLCKRIAAHYGLQCLDTGLLYRAVALALIRRGLRLHDVWAAVAVARSLDPARLGESDLRRADVGEGASVVAKIPQVRAALLAYQRSFARQSPGAVLDGRDIATVVCPEADVKIFVTATPEARAKRRHLEYLARGIEITEAEVLALIIARDARDSGRADAPLKQDDQAVLLDTTELDIDAAFDVAIGVIKRKIGR